MTFTYENIVETIKQKESGFIGSHLPMWSMHYMEFAERSGINIENYPRLETYIKKASYQEKRTIFESLGFDVLYLTLSGTKAMHYAEGRIDYAPSNPTIDEAFLKNERNVFLFNIESGLKEIYFVIEYQSEDALADFTIDREEIKREKKQKAKMRSFLARVRGE